MIFTRDPYIKKTHNKHEKILFQPLKQELKKNYFHIAKLFSYNSHN